MRVAAFQFDVRTADVAANLAAVERGLRAAAEQGIALVVLPEMWPTSFPSEPPDSALFAASDRALARVAELSREHALVVAGSAFGRAQGEPNKHTNRFHLFDRGELVARYDKVHLFTPTAEHESFVAGDDPPSVAATSIGRIGAAVCYDLRFPELVRVLFRGGAEILVIPAQWPAPRVAHWRALTVARAVESQCFVVACNRTGRALIGRRGEELSFPGDARIVDPDGGVLAEGGSTESLLSAEIDLEKARTARVRIPVAKDERPELYARWNDSRGTPQRYRSGG